MLKKAATTDLFNFQIRDNYIQFNGRQFYFLRIAPPPISVLSTREKEIEANKILRILNDLKIPMQWISLDKTEDFSKHKNFFLSFEEEYDEYTSEIISSIESTEINSNNIKKSNYFVISVKNEEEIRQIQNKIKSKQVSFTIALKPELVLIMRNYLLREFTTQTILGLEREIFEKYAQLNPSQKKKKNKVDYFFSELTKRITPHNIKFLPKYIVQNDFKRKVIMANNLPSTSAGTFWYLRHLAKIKNSTLSIHLEPMKFSARLVNMQANNKKQFRKNQLTEAIDSEREQEVLGKVWDESQQERNAFYKISIFVEYYGKGKDFEDTRIKVEDELTRLSITYDVLNSEQQLGFLSVYPLGKDHFKNCANNLSSKVISTLYPFSSSNRLDENGFLLGETEDGGAMFVDFDDRDEAPNGNFSVFGTSGFGKTYLMSKIESQHMMSGRYSTYILDPEDEYVQMYSSAGKSVVTANDRRSRINPLEVRLLRDVNIDDGADDEGNKDGDAPSSIKYENMYFQHLSWLKDFFTVLFPNLTEDQKDALYNYIIQTYKAKGISQSTSFIDLSAEDYPILEDLYNIINNDITAQLKNPETDSLVPLSVAKELRLKLKNCVDGDLGHIFNGATTLKDSKHICFALQALMDGDENRFQAVMFNILTFLWNRLTLRKEKILLIIDELHKFFDERGSIVARYIKDFAKRIRKYGGKIGVATQNFTDINIESKKHITMGIFNNTAFKFIFYPGDADLEPLANALDLREGEVDCIKKEEPHHCLLKVAKSKYYFKVGTFDYEQNIFGQTQEEETEKYRDVRTKRTV